MALLRLIRLDALMQRCDLLSQLNNPSLSERIHYQNYTLDGFSVSVREQHLQSMSEIGMFQQHPTSKARLAARV
jgi:hypothetical protein